MASPNGKPKVMFLSEMCLLDRNSGAAISSLSWLEVMQKAGFECSSVTMSLFDGNDEYPFQQELAPKLDPQKNIGRTLRVERNGITHRILVTGTSRGSKVSRKVISAYQKMAAQEIVRTKPDVIYGYASPYSNPLRRLAKKHGARVVFYLANGNYTEVKRDYFKEVEHILVPSDALGAHYKSLMGLDTESVRSVVPQHIDIQKFSAKEKAAERKTGFVTQINPSPQKGGKLFLRLAQLALTEAPELVFLAVESRGARHSWEQKGVNVSALTNIWWIPKQKNIRAVYDRTAVLLSPSIWLEASSRVCAEAQLCGIPVLATRSGGIPAQLNGGGYLFDIPDVMRDNYSATPSVEDVRPWLETIKSLMDDEAVYQAASEKALEASKPFRPEVREKEIVELFQRLADK